MFEKGAVEIVDIGGKKYIKKKLLSDINIQMCFSKKTFVDYLIGELVPTAKIIGYEIKDNSIIETQEFIGESDKIYAIKDYIKMVAMFHRTSSSYKNEIIQKKVLNNSVQIGNVYLKRTLLGFDEKYYLYPREVLKNSRNSSKTVQTILVLHDKLYGEFIQCVDDRYCIIHNDLTPYNIIRGKFLYLIDFDLAIKSFEYVDVADILFNRNLDIYDYLHLLKDNYYLEEVVKEYNSVNCNKKLCVHGIKLMAAIKLFTYIMYIFSQNNQIEDKLCEYLCLIYKEVVEC